MLNYLGQGALLIGRPGGSPANPFFLLAPEELRLPLVILATMADRHRQPGGDFGRLFGDAAGGPAGLPAAPEDHRTPARVAEGRSTSRSINWGLLVLVIAAGAGLQIVVEPGRRLWHRGDRHDVHRHLLAGVLLVSPCGTGTAGWRCRCSALFLIVDVAYFASNLTKVPDGGWFPLVDRPDHLHAA